MSTSSRTLFNFQRQSINTLLNSPSPNNYLALDMGLGKTVTAISYCNEINATRVLIVCPNVVKYNWKKELIDWSEFDIGEPVVINKKKDLKPGSVFIVNYELLARSRDVLEYVVRNGKYSALILDEAHKVRNPTTKQSKICIDILQTISKHTLYLSGTLVTKSAEEIQPTLKTITPYIQDRISPKMFKITQNYFEFRSYFANKKERFDDERVYYDGIRRDRLDEYKSLVRDNGFYVRYLKEDVRKDLPSKIYTRIKLPVKSKGSLDVETAKKHLQTLYRSKDNHTDADARGAFIRYTRLVGELKANCKQFYEFVEDILYANESVLIFAWHKGVIDIVKNNLEHHNPVVITGDTDSSKRQEYIDQFQAGETKVFIGNIIAAGVGATLTKASKVIMLQWDWLPANNEQAIDRAHRIGQKNTVNVYYMVADNYIDDILINHMNKRKELVHGTI